MSGLRLAVVAATVLAMLTVGTATASADATVFAQAPRGDGCTRVPDSYLGANFRPACDRHDKCYSHTSRTDRIDCDKRLLVDLGRACKDEFGKFNPLRYSCLDMAAIYSAGVRNFGRSHYKGKGNPA